MKKGISPIIATVLLVSITVILALVLFMWFKSITKEAITKAEGENIENFCDKLSFSASYSASTLTITNNGNVGIYDFQLRKKSGLGSYTTVDASTEFTNWEKGLVVGKTFSGAKDFSSVREIVLIPVLLGTGNSGVKKIHSCGEQFSKTVKI